MQSKYKLNTQLVRSGAEADPETGAIAPPIHLATTYLHSPDGIPEGGHLYQRQSNPTQSRLECALAQVESGEAALAYASGLGAASGLFQTLPKGTRVIFHKNIYYATQSLVHQFFHKWDLRFEEQDLTQTGTQTPLPEKSVLWIESPSNPHMEVLDITALGQKAAASNGLLVVDNTFSTMALQRPLSLGADVVLYSATKYLGGHSDVMGGALVFSRKDKFYEDCLNTRTLTGGVLSPATASFE